MVLMASHMEQFGGEKPSLRNGSRACFMHFIHLLKLSDISAAERRSDVSGSLWQPPSGAEALMREHSEAAMRGITAHRKRWLMGGSAHA